MVQLEYEENSNEELQGEKSIRPTKNSEAASILSVQKPQQLIFFELLHRLLESGLIWQNICSVLYNLEISGVEDSNDAFKVHKISFNRLKNASSSFVLYFRIVAWVAFQ